MASPYNIETPTMDFSRWLKRDFSKENRGGALADALNAVADTSNAYGETADKELLSKYANETDASKVDGADFFNKLNALNAKKIVTQNQQKAYEDELKARDDAQYHINTFNKEAANDAYTMSKDEFNSKYNNAGGLDYGIMNNIFNDKEDRINSQKDRTLKNNLTNLKINKANYDLSNAKNKAAIEAQARKQKDIDNKFMIDYYNGNLNDELINQYQNNVSADVFGNVMTDKKVNQILSKYPDFNSFKNSEDWANPDYNYAVKKTVYDSFGKGGGKSLSFNEQIKKAQIDSNLQSLDDIKKQYKEKYGEDMPAYVQSNFIYKNVLPDKLVQKDEKKELKQPPAKEVSEFQALEKYESVLDELEKAYDPSYVGGVDSSLNTISPNWVLSDGHRKFNNLMNDVLLGKTSALTGTLSDRDMALLQSSGLSETLGEKDFLEKLRKTKEQVKQMKATKYDLLKKQYDLPESFNQTTKNENPKKDTPKINSIRKKDDKTEPKQKEVIKELRNPVTGEVKKWSNIRGFINE